MQKSKLKKSAKMKLLRNGKVTADESEVGYVVFETDKNQSKKDLIDFFGKEDSQFINVFRKLRMPKEFTLVWIDKFYIKQSQRSKGFGAKILRMLERKFKNHTLVIGLSPGQLVKTTNVDKLIPFYEGNGYKVISTKDHYYGFKVIKKKQI